MLLHRLHQSNLRRHHKAISKGYIFPSRHSQILVQCNFSTLQLHVKYIHVVDTSECVAHKRNVTTQTPRVIRSAFAVAVVLIFNPFYRTHDILLLTLLSNPILNLFYFYCNKDCEHQTSGIQKLPYPPPLCLNKTFPHAYCCFCKLFILMGYRAFTNRNMAHRENSIHYHT